MPFSWTWAVTFFESIYFHDSCIKQMPVHFEASISYAKQGSKDIGCIFSYHCRQVRACTHIYIYTSTKCYNKLFYPMHNSKIQESSTSRLILDLSSEFSHCLISQWNRKNTKVISTQFDKLSSICFNSTTLKISQVTRLKIDESLSLF